MMIDSTALDSPLVGELLALLAVLRSTMHCLGQLDLNCQLPDKHPVPPEQLEPLKRQLKQLHRVGLKLSARWEGFQDEDQCKTDFVLSLACEVRNLVSIVLNTMGTLERYGTRLEPSRRLALLTRVKQALEDLTSLLEEAEILSSPCGLQPKADLVSVDIYKLCEGIIRERKVDAPDRLIRLIRKGKSRLEVIDEVWLKQILNKVLDNAIAYSPSNSIVILKVVWTADELQFQIQDLGIGIPPTEQGNIFKPFYRANNAQAVSGRGLGLAIANQAMTLQGGTIRVLSTLGQGTNVTLNFPKVQEMNELQELLPTTTSNSIG